MHNMIGDRSSSTRAPMNMRYIRNPELLKTGMLVGEDQPLITGSKTPSPIGTWEGDDTREHSRLQEFGSARHKHVDRSICMRAPRDRKRTRH